MTSPVLARRFRPQDALLIEGYASLFGVADRSGDIVRAGAFAGALAAASVPMLLQHAAKTVIGHWVRLVEDGRGLFVRGLVEADIGKAAVSQGMTGLSIGFRPLIWTARPSGGRMLIKIDLVEISLVQDPMLPAARFDLMAGKV